MFEITGQFITNVLILGLVCWRLSTMLVRENGPFDILANFRDWIGVMYDPYQGCDGKNVLAKMLCCYKCTSVWVGLLLSVVFFRLDILQTLVLALVFSGLTVFIEEKL